MKNNIINLLLILGSIVNLFLSFLASSQFINNKDSFFFLILIFASTIIALILFCFDYILKYSDDVFRNICLFIFKFIFFINSSILITLVLYFLTNNEDWLLPCMNISFVFVLTDLIHCFLKGKSLYTVAFILSIILTSIHLKDNNEIIIGTFGIYYIFDFFKDSSESINIDSSMRSFITHFKNNYFVYKSQIGLILFSFTMSALLTGVLIQSLLYAKSLNLFPFYNDFSQTNHLIIVLVENLLLLFLTGIIYAYIKIKISNFKITNTNNFNIPS